jgi:hypothetical protein
LVYSTIRPVIEAVLSLVDFEIEKLPNLTTACKMVNEMGTISRMQLQEQLSSSKLTILVLLKMELIVKSLD